MNPTPFYPFYEHFADRFGIVLGRILVSGLLGLLFLVPHAVSLVFLPEPSEGCTLGGVLCEITHGRSWLLAVLIYCAMLCLYHATWTLRRVLEQMKRLRSTENTPDYFTALNRTLSNRRFILAGCFFGGLNAVIGFVYEVPYEGVFVLVTLYGGFILAGFVCGMAVWGIYGVVAIMHTYTSEGKLKLDFTAPDQCGGTYMLGEAFVKFSLVTLIAGMLICAYILAFPWENADNGWVKALRWFWIAYPFIMSLIALFAPAMAINRALRKCKIEKEEKFKEHLVDLRRCITDRSLDKAERDALREDYEYQTQLRQQLFTMRTWPFSISASISFTLTFLGSAASQVVILANFSEIFLG